MTRNEFINKHQVLFWYTPADKKQEISDSLLVETLLNYGSLSDIKEMFDVLGIDYVAKCSFLPRAARRAIILRLSTITSRLFSTAMLHKEILNENQQNLLDLAAMKAFALGRRSKWKD